MSAKSNRCRYLLKEYERKKGRLFQCRCHGGFYLGGLELEEHIAHLNILHGSRDKKREGLDTWQMDIKVKKNHHPKGRVDSIKIGK